MYLAGDRIEGILVGLKITSQPGDVDTCLQSQNSGGIGRQNSKSCLGQPGLYREMLVSKTKSNYIPSREEDMGQINMALLIT